jgi:hypothetical protein
VDFHCVLPLTLAAVKPYRWLCVRRRARRHHKCCCFVSSGSGCVVVLNERAVVCGQLICCFCRQLSVAFCVPACAFHACCRACERGVSTIKMRRYRSPTGSGAHLHTHPAAWNGWFSFFPLQTVTLWFCAAWSGLPVGNATLQVKQRVYCH